MLPAVLLPVGAGAARRGLRAQRRRAAGARRHPGAALARAARSIGLYYYGEVTMKEIGREIGVNESRVSQLHARAIRRLRDALGSTLAPADAAGVIRARRCCSSCRSPRPRRSTAWRQRRPSRRSGGVVIPYARASRAARSKSPRRNGFASQRQPLCARKRSASVPATSPVTNITRRASSGDVTAIAR